MTDRPDGDVVSSRATWLRHLTASRVLGDVTRALEGEGIPVLPVKGIVTAHSLYRDVVERPMGDIDLRLRPRDFRRAMRVGRARGWRAESVTPRFGEASLHVDGWEVEIECALGPPGLCAVSVDDLVARATSSSEGVGFAHLEPEIHDHALLLCINAFKDLLRITPWALEDLVRVALHGAFEPRSLVERARLGEVATLVWIVADWLARTGKGSRWAEVRERIGATPPRPGYASAYAATVQRAVDPRLELLLVASAADRPSRVVRATAFAAAGWLRGAVRRRLPRRA